MWGRKWGWPHCRCHRLSGLERHKEKKGGGAVKEKSSTNPQRKSAGLHWRCRHTKPRFNRQLLSFHLPSDLISTQFSSTASPGWKASLGSPGAQFMKPRDEWSVQAQPTGNTHCVSVTSVCLFFSSSILFPSALQLLSLVRPIHRSWYQVWLRFLMNSTSALLCTDASSPCNSWQ